MNNNKFYESIVNGLTDFIALLDTNYTYTGINPAYSKALGMDEDDVIGKTPADLFGEELFNSVIKPEAKRCLQGKNTNYQSWFNFKTLGKRYMDVHLHPHYSDNAQIDGYIVQLSDITESHRQQIALSDYKLAVENAMQGISRLDANGVFVMVRDDYGKMLGYDNPEELVGKPWTDTVPEEDHHKGIAAFETMLKEGRGEGETLALRKDGSTFYKHVLLVQIKDENGNHKGHYCFMRDITKRKQTEIKLIENECRLQEIISATNVGTWEWDLKSGNMSLSTRWAEIAGYQLEELLPFSSERWKELIHPDDVEKAETLLQKHFSRQLDYYVSEYRIRHKKGHWLWVTERGQVVEWGKDDTPVRMSGTLSDINRNKIAEQELNKLSLAVEASNASIVITDTQGNIEYVNPGFIKNYGYQKHEVLGRNIDVLNSKQASMGNYDELRLHIKNGRNWRGILPHKRKDGTIQQDRVIISSVKNDQGKITNYISIQEDITYEYELSKKLSFQASHDALTGLVNRREFERRALRLLGSVKTTNLQHALCFLDLDQFKVVNDTCGHVAGDELLRQISTVLREEIRDRDTLARLGGDEFAILMEHCTLEDAKRVASTIQNTLQEYQFTWGEHVFRIGASIGLVPIDENIEDLNELMKHADAACYAAKELGRNRIHVFHHLDETLAQRQGEMQWVTKIYRALESDQFCLFAQRIEPLNSASKECHYELLLRMCEHDGKIYPPGSFLPAAERYNLISKIDRWVIQHALKVLSLHPEFLEEVKYVSINISGQSLTEDSFIEFVIDQLRQYADIANKICFEITETAAIANLTKAREMIIRLKELGCYFALDDFGSGLSSFAYLKNLPVDSIKIDGMFVKDIPLDPIDHAMVKSINEIAQVMGMQTIAEFVENDSIKDMLSEIGVNYAQGFGIGKPVQLGEILDLTAPLDNVIAINNA